jgi:hypothetical protein
MFLEQNPDVKSFDIYHPAWDFIKDQPKFQSILVALSSAPPCSSKEPTDEQEYASSMGISPKLWPNGTKKSKRLLKEEKIIENVSSVLQSNLNNGISGASGMLAAALDKFTTVITTSIQTWQQSQREA